MNLTKHFTFEELTNTSHTSLVQQNRQSARNSESVMNNLNMLAMLMEELRQLVGEPIIVTSGYRMPILNKTVGGSQTSKHIDGLCCDFKPSDMPVAEAFFKIIDRKDDIKLLRKCIIEGVKGKTWIHVQVKTNPKEKTNFYATTDGKTYKEVV